MDLFGFEEDLDLPNSQVIPVENVLKPKMKVQPSDDGQKLTISQIQDLLLKDIANDTVSDQDTFEETDTSIFEETTSSKSIPSEAVVSIRRTARKVTKNVENISSLESCIMESELKSPKVRPKRKVKKILQSIQAFDDTENVALSELKVPITQAYTKKTRQKKALQSIENTHTNDVPNSSSSKTKKNSRKKAKVKKNENENVDNIAEEINNKFKEVEQYRLVVE